MPEKETIKRAQADKRAGKAPSTQAGEFVREEMHHVREGKHGARSSKQAIAIGLSKARRSGVKLPPPKKGAASTRARKQAARDTAKGKHPTTAKSPRRSRAVSKALRREGHSAASPRALAKQARSSARRRQGKLCARRDPPGARRQPRRARVLAPRTGGRLGPDRPRLGGEVGEQEATLIDQLDELEASTGSGSLSLPGRGSLSVTNL